MKGFTGLLPLLQPVFRMRRSQVGATLIPLILGSGLFMVAILALVGEIDHLFILKNSFHLAVDLSAKSAARKVDLSLLAEQRIVRIKPLEAEVEFYRLLRKNLRLDQGLDPLAGSMAGGRVEVEFRVLNAGPEKPVTDDITGDLITAPTVHALVRVPVRLRLPGMGDELVAVPVHVDVTVGVVSP